MTIPKKDKQARCQDLQKVLLPEMIPDQLKILGISLTDIVQGSYFEAKSHNAAGIKLAELLNNRAHAIKTNQTELYAERSKKRHLTQLDHVINNYLQLMNNAIELSNILPLTENEAIYKKIDQLIEITLHMGYYAGSNDSLAITDRYSNSGYDSKITNPKKGGDSKSENYQCVIDLTYQMAEHIYLHKELTNTSRACLVKAIHNVLSEFSKTQDNNTIKAFLKFDDRSPKMSTINNWLSLKSDYFASLSLSLPETELNPKPSLNRLIEELKKTYNHKSIKKALK